MDELLCAEDVGDEVRAVQQLLVDHVALKRRGKYEIARCYSENPMVLLPCRFSFCFYL